MRFKLDIKLWDKEKPDESVMSNSEYEWKTNQEFISKARGDVLMVGLGIGYTLPFILPKIESIEILEKEEEVIELAQVFHAVHNKKVFIIHADATEYIPLNKYDVIFWDSWGDVGDRKEQLERYRPFLKEGGDLILWQS